ncbi:Mov34/MPN/PAD-1 family protein [Leptolyngbya sp. 7M]|uniref:Mov34/MPN/PAD-1 family protein n=1 Tax=Leptolyngbya sp. 7M TaxID=2812896 RepID=UPI001B8CA6EB|nr:M67 family metallopeptidase [Leptolyngbya sp. 7M]QYO66799.1 M67 family metallopeptidase [Leptolyngbya sp. 7M]
MIYLDENSISEIRAHTERDYPYECGGMLLGKFVDGNKTVAEIFPLANAREAADRHDRILILPSDVMRADKYARTKGLDIVGYYHSHPDDTAEPSQYDLDHALPVWSYVIVSVLSGKAADLRSWEMEDDRSKFNEEELKNVGSRREIQLLGAW